MTTRVELWKNYRKEINENISLQKAVQKSHSGFEILRKRLIDAFPDYDKIFESKLSVFKADVETIEAASKIPLKELEELIENLSVDEDFSNINSQFNNIDFSSHELDDVIEQIEKGRESSEIIFEKQKVKDIIIKETKVIELGANMTKLRIAIDGPSGSGKSTVARLIAKRYGLTYINTGLVYRAIALNAIKLGINFENEDEIISSMEEDMIELKPNEVVFLKGKDVSKALRADIVSQGASKVAAINKVREYALDVQKKYGAKPGVIMDGRDTTFKVMPDANLKIFLDTAPEVRAQRRVNQNKILGFSTDYDIILKEIKERDHRDSTREKDPLHKTDDAHLIDASDMSLEEVIAEVEKLIKNI